MVKKLRLQESQGADWIHVDVMDGHFAQYNFWSTTLQRYSFPYKNDNDIHLMISNVDDYITTFAKTGADIITAHIEAGKHSHRTMQAIRASGCKAGIALNPSTPAESIEYLLDEIDLVCVMTVNRFWRSEVHSFTANKDKTKRNDSRSTNPLGS